MLSATLHFVSGLFFCSFFGIPEDFVSKYGKDLSSSVTFRLPCGSEWEVELTRYNGEVRFEKGWPDFSKFYSPGYNDLLVFGYEGKSRFQEDQIGYIKVVGPWSGQKNSIPVLDLVMIMTMLLIIIAVMRLIWWRKKKHTRASVDVWNSSSSSELEISSIPGLPIRFNYEELVTATESFKTQNWQWWL
ncbi:putative transcription factor B3-Domain family [Rosa chinensis]|uniref:Putative transcription factor B3-Domain family n=1 Tax=Rosa chinensis TaxID=74649 RepID=A0A2P6PEL0_ROSCH|nr:putative transcription factor B3-Domain family [Rosa chinensis]